MQVKTMILRNFKITKIVPGSDPSIDNESYLICNVFLSLTGLTESERLVEDLNECFMGCITVCLTECIPECLTESLTEGPTVCLTECLTDCLN